jgi:hypothetical protein
MSFRQDRTNPSSAISNWKGRSETPKAHPSTAVSTWMNSGLFSAGGDNWVWRWAPGDVSSGTGIGAWIYGLRYQENAGDDYLWIGAGSGNSVYAYLNMTSLEWSAFVQNSLGTHGGTRGIYLTTYFANSGVGSLASQTSGSQNYSTFNEGFTPSNTSLQPSNSRQIYWTNSYPYATYPYTQACVMGNPGGSDDGRYYGLYTSFGSYFATAYTALTMGTGHSNAAPAWGKQVYRNSWTSYPVGLETTGSNSSGYVYGLSTAVLGSNRYVDMVRMSNAAGSHSVTVLGDSNHLPQATGLCKVNHDSADYFYASMCSHSSSATYNYNHIVKYDTNQSIQWQRKVQPSGVDASQVGSGAGNAGCCPAADGGVFQVADMADNQTNGGTNRRRLWITKWDKNGTREWSRALYKSNTSGNYTIGVHQMAGTADGDLILAAITHDDATSEWTTLIFFLKGDGSGTGSFALGGETCIYSDSLTLNESAGSMPTGGTAPSTSGGNPQVGNFAQASVQAYVPTDLERIQF